MQQEDIIKEIKRHSFYLKPGEKRRTKEALARKRIGKSATKTSSNLLDGIKREGRVFQHPPFRFPCQST